MVTLTHQTIDTAAAVARAQQPEAGAVVCFLGTARQFTGGRQTRFLEYESHAAAAVREMERLECEARARWDLIECEIVHRLGRIELGEASVLVVVSTPHRQAAFEAGAWLIDQLKQRVAIWKQEHWADGTSEWVHPGLNRPEDPVSERPQ